MGDTSKVDTKEFKETMRQTDESETAEERALDSEALETVVAGRQVVYFDGYGDVIFDFPDTGLAIDADTVATRFRTKALRSGEFLTESQLKTIYRQPTTVKVDGKDIVIGNGEWPEKYDRELDQLPKLALEAHTHFTNYRAEYQKNRDEAAALEESTKKTQLQEKRNKAETSALDYYQVWLKHKARQMELGSLRAKLFADSIEELAFFEKIKFLAPACTKQADDKGVEAPLWKSEDDMRKDTFNATRVIAAFNMFMRGLDVSFFADAPDESITS